MTSKPATIGIVASQRQAERILTALEGAGVSKEDISVLFAGDPGRAGDDIVTGSARAAAGAAPVASDMRALRAAIGVVAIPGDGLFIAAGPILNELSGGLIGASSRSIAATLIGMGIAEPEARRYEEQIRGGRVLVSVHVDGPDARALAKAILSSGRAVDICSCGEGSGSSPPRAVSGALS